MQIYEENNLRAAIEYAIGEAIDNQSLTPEEYIDLVKKIMELIIEREEEFDN